MSNARELMKGREWMSKLDVPTSNRQMEAEGGCGVVGLASTMALPGRHFFESLRQMHNRGNGKGGGIAAVGLSPEQMKVSKEVLENDYLVQIAYIDPSVRNELESRVLANYDVHATYMVDESDDPAVLADLPVRPPQVWRYFCRAKKDVMAKFVEERKLGSLDARRAEDEFVYQTNFGINLDYYASGKMKAFVMSQGRNMIIMKVVGYAEDVIRFYRMEDFTAHVWIGHQRYPTKGRVWHPGGAHPFMGLDEGLVHNGDFANYHSVSEYLAQRNIRTLFLTDTEVSVLLFDLMNRGYGYPLEYIIEALAPTTERDFNELPAEKQKIYQAIQRAHVHSSPDGPWFFIIAQNCYYEGKQKLIGITDTAMLRPQVFALVEGDVQIGLVASEKQAIDAALRSINADHPEVPRQADVYWNARGGSHTDGGAFIFSLDGEEGSKRLKCSNKFGAPVTIDLKYDRKEDAKLSAPLPIASMTSDHNIHAMTGDKAFAEFLKDVRTMDHAQVQAVFAEAVKRGKRGGKDLDEMLGFLNLVIDRRYDPGRVRRSRLTEKALESINAILRSMPRVGAGSPSAAALVDWKDHELVKASSAPGSKLFVDCRDFPMEGEEGPSFVIRKAHELGWRHVIMFDAHGQRFFGCGLGPDTEGMRIEGYGNPGDYLASGLSGAEMIIHGNAQDQLGQVMASGRLVVHGDVGQTFMYGAKGGDAYILGNAAGRPLINAVGRPRVIINGTCLDYLAESFMAGDPLNGGGFVILNGLGFGTDGRPYELQTPYPGSNLFSLASGGAIYIRDPGNKVTSDQINGGRIGTFGKADWDLIRPYLEENERLFGISVEGFLLSVDGKRMAPEEVYRKIEAIPVASAKKAAIVIPDDDEASA
jgi:glutamate synthase domain-containing protein 1